MKRGEKKRKKKEQGEIVATFKDNEKSFNGVTVDGCGMLLRPDAIASEPFKG